jgi:hypothetical protein
MITTTPAVLLSPPPPPTPVQLLIPAFSRYTGTKIYQDTTSGEAFFGPWTAIDFPPATDDSWVTIRDLDGLRLDYVSYRNYGTSDLWWVVARANDIQNPFTQLYGYTAYAKSPLVFAADGRACFYATAREPGQAYNVDDVKGLTFQTTETTLTVYVAGLFAESYNALSPYPLDEAGNVDLKFWGAAPSAWLVVHWVATDILRPSLSGIEGPRPQPTRSYLTGGVDPRKIALRLPSRDHISAILDTFRTP